VKRKFLNKSKPNPEDIWYVLVNGEMIPKEGYQEVFDEDGIFVGKGNYKNGVRNGFWQFFHTNGKLSNCGYYGDDGLRLSIKEYGDTWDYYDESGKKLFDTELPEEFQEYFNDLNEQMAEDIFRGE
tara:strand:- start:115 stop:492 length:378 start_codon:yes stop_codon:yes gene_type:complete